MSTILGLFFFIIIIVLVIGLSLIRGVLRLIFGFGLRTTSQNSQQNRTYQDSYRRNEKESYNNDSSSQAHNRKKIFDDDEGEYVDFEEVKDDRK